MTKGKGSFVLVMVLYLLGIFMGAIDTGIVTPARTVIQDDLGVNPSSGIWMITIYTLAYAAAIPIMGKLADRLGRKRIYLVAIGLFGLGSLLCGLSQDVGSFPMLVICRAVQAVGGGGIVPIATAEFGTSVPVERRGMALGMVGGVYGVANVFGASAGSLILDIAGSHNWQWIFYVNVPIALVIILAGVVVLPDHRRDEVKPIDALGGLVLVTMIMSLLYGLRSLDFFDLGTSLTSPDVWPFLVVFLIGLPVLIRVERRAVDPVLQLRYFSDRGIGLTMLLSMLSGVVLMGVVFVPQFSENAIDVAAGKGGYFVIILGLASGVGAPLSGRFTDLFGPRMVLGLGFGLSALAGLTAVVWAIPRPGWPSVVAVLVLMGLGLGFVVGSALNYLMLERTPESEANSALATLSLVRSIGTTVAPALMVGFLTHAAVGLQPAITAELPTTINIPALPHASELATELEALKSDPQFADQLTGIDTELLTRTSIDIDMSGSGDELSPALVVELQGADVTTITAVTKDLASAMFDEQLPAIEQRITSGVQSGLDSMNEGLTRLNAVVEASGGRVPELVDSRDRLQTTIDQLTELRDAIPSAFAQAEQDYLNQIDARSDQLEHAYQSTINEGFRNLYLFVAAACALAVALPFGVPTPGSRPRDA